MKMKTKIVLHDAYCDVTYPNIYLSAIDITNRNYSAILATLQITSYALGV